MSGSFTETSTLAQEVIPRRNKEILIHRLTTEQKNVYDQCVNQKESKLLKIIRSLEKRLGFVTPLRWINIFIIFGFHLIALVFLIDYFFIKLQYPKWQTFLFGLLMGQVAGFGVTAGVHRFWSHRSYKATLPMQLLLLFCYSVAGQNTIFEWVRDHRVHHKFSETSADPHDARRGFFFSHVGWLLMKKHPRVKTEGQKIDMSDILEDPLIMFHTKHFTLFKLSFCFILPTLVPVYCWDESWTFALFSQVFVRYIMSLNFTWSVNSFAHLWGNKPYDRFIMPTENWGVSMVAMGEGWHNYHHSFPWDYKAAELGHSINSTTFLLDLFAKIGWVYDLKTASPTLVKAVARNRGDQAKEHQH